MVTGLARDGSLPVVLLGIVRATGFAKDSEVLAVPAYPKFLAALSFLGGSHPLEFSLLLVCELGLGNADGTLALDGAGPIVGGPLAGFAGTGFGVASVSRHGEDENVVERTAYWPRLRGDGWAAVDFPDWQRPP